MATITSNNPHTGENIKTYDLITDEEMSSIIDQCHEHYLSFRQTSFADRAGKMIQLAKILRERKQSLAEIMTNEMGKTFSSAVSEVEKCAWVCEYYAEHAESFLADEPVDTDATSSYIAYQPIGVVLAVMPWNYPLWQVFRFAVPALMAGNTAVLKHASNVPECGQQIEQVIHDAGFDRCCFRHLMISSSQVAKVLENPLIRAATLTGSGPAGSAVAATAGEHIKKTVLELGGNDAYLILHDADLDHAAEQCVKSRLLNTGQSCIGAKRFVVVDAVYEEFIEKFKTRMSEKIMGDPMQQVDIGPMARTDLRDEVHQQVIDSVKAGAELILGGHIPEGAGAFYPATILTNVKPGMPAHDDEIFGPVASVIRVADEEEAIKVANDSKFGLGSCVFTQDKKRGEAIAKNKIDAGCCFVNAFVKSDPRLPFGGVKESGYGRELSYYGIREFTNVKTVYVA